MRRHMLFPSSTDAQNVVVPGTTLLFFARSVLHLVHTTIRLSTIAGRASFQNQQLHALGLASTKVPIQKLRGKREKTRDGRCSCVAVLLIAKTVSLPAILRPHNFFQQLFGRRRTVLEGTSRNDRRRISLKAGINFRAGKLGECAKNKQVWLILQQQREDV